MEIQTDSDKNVWILDFFGVTRFDGTKFTAIKKKGTISSSIVKLGQGEKGEKYVVDFRGHIFFIEDDTLRALALNDTLPKLNPLEGVTDTYMDAQGRIHISFSKTGYFLIEDGKITQPLKEKGHAITGYACILRGGKLPFMVDASNAPPPNQTRSYYLFNEQLELVDTLPISQYKYRLQNQIAQKSDGNYLYSAGIGNLIEFNSDGFVQEIDYPYEVSGLLIDNFNGLWLSTEGKGLYYYEDAVISEKNRVTLQDSTIVIATSQDYEGNIWCYSITHGLGYIPNPYIKYYSYDNQLLPAIRALSIQVIGDSLYCSFVNNELAILDIRTDELTKMNLPPTEELVRYLHFDQQKKRLWISTQGTIQYYEDGKWHKIATDMLSGISPQSLLRFRQNKSLPNTSLVGVHLNQFFTCGDSSINYVSPIYPDHIIDVLFQGDSTWVATRSGLYLQVNEAFTYCGDQFPELKKSVFQLCEFDNKLWIKTLGGGISTFYNGILTPIKYNGELITGATNNYFHLQNDSTLWLLGQHGSFEFSTHGKANHSSNLYVSAYGAIPDLFIRGFANNDSSLFIQTRRNGIVRIEFEDLKKDPYILPIPRVNLLKINGSKQEVSDSLFELDFDESFIQINYSSISYRDLALIYRHRMLGLNDGWSETTENYIQFTTLPPGSFTFEIQCKKGKYAWSDSRLLHFEIAPPFWQTWWFRIFSLAVILCGIYAIFTYRLKVAQRERDLVIDRLKAEQKALQAQMDPHFVFNIIASVQYLIMEGAKNKAYLFLSMFSKSMRNILDQSNNNDITIENEIKFLTEYIEMERFRLEDHFDFQFQKSLSQEELQSSIPPFIVQPFVENAIQHGLKNKEGNGALLLKYDTTGDFLKITVEDNGVGRKVAGTYKQLDTYKGLRKSHGIRIIKERLLLHNKRDDNVNVLDLTDSSGLACGTKVEVRIRMKRPT